LAASARELVLVLDDYHLVHGEAIHDSVAFLLRHRPPGVHVAVSARADPPLPLARLRAAGEVTEIRAAQLAFSDAEADALLNGSLALDLETTDVQLLQSRTEGWAAGLQLAGLSLYGQADKHAFVEAFAGDERQIGEYLHEVLREQPEALREFLLHSSILERMCAPLCDAVTGGDDAADQREAALRRRRPDAAEDDAARHARPAPQVATRPRRDRPETARARGTPRRLRRRPEHYPVVGEVLIASMAKIAGAAWRPDYERAWGEAFALVAAAMLEGAGTASREAA
jgi:LuxR family maltose regulon positive regulatory protein